MTGVSRACGFYRLRLYLPICGSFACGSPAATEVFFKVTIEPTMYHPWRLVVPGRNPHVLSQVSSLFIL